VENVEKPEQVSDSRLNLHTAMAEKAPPPKVEAAAYTVGLIYVKPIEMTAITTMVDKIHALVPLANQDDNEYVLGGSENTMLQSLAHREGSRERCRLRPSQHAYA
jgi:hypothetical protein